MINEVPMIGRLLKVIILGLVINTDLYADGLVDNNQIEELIALLESPKESSVTNIESKSLSLIPGDILFISLPGEPDFNRDFKIDRQGNLLLPELGSFSVQGLSVEQAKLSLRQKFQEIYRDIARFDIYLKERHLLVSVLGYVKQPGTVELDENGNLQTAINAAGGLKQGAQLDRIQLRREDTVILFNYKNYLDTGDISNMPELKSLDTIFVPASPLIGNVQVDFDAKTLASNGDAGEDTTAIKIFGEVNNPGSYAYKDGSNLIDVLMRAGGVTRFATVEQIRVISDGKPILVNLKEYLDTGNNENIPSIVPGMTIFVPKQEEEIKSGIRTVYIMGEVFKPGAYETKPNTSFLDVLANAGGPSRFAETRQIRIMHTDGSVTPFDLQAFTEGSGKGEIPRMRPGDAIFVPEKTDVNQASWLKVSPQRAVKVLGAVLNPGRFQWSDEMSLLDLLAHAGGPSNEADTTKIKIVAEGVNGEITTHYFNLEEFLTNDDKSRKLPVIKGRYSIIVPEHVRDISNPKSSWLKQSSDRSIYIFGQVTSPGRYMYTNEFSFLDILSAANGPTANADIYNVRVLLRRNSKTEVFPLNLALFFETGDYSLLPVLRAGDSIFIPEKKRNWLEEKKENTVRVIGAVAKPGRYRFNDEMTLLDLLAEAGGTRSDAYVDKILVVNKSCCNDKSTSFDLNKFAKSGDFGQLPLVRVGDTIYVPTTEESHWKIFMSSVRDVLSILSVILIIGVL